MVDPLLSTYHCGLLTLLRQGPYITIKAALPEICPSTDLSALGMWSAPFGICTMHLGIGGMTTKGAKGLPVDFLI